MPPINLQELIVRYPDSIKTIIEKLIQVGYRDIVLTVIQQNREVVMEILFKDRELAEMLIMIMPELVSIIPKLAELYPYLLNIVKYGAPISWESVSQYVESVIQHYFPAYEDMAEADTKLLVAYWKGLSSVSYFKLSATSPVKLNVYLTNELRVEGGVWIEYKWIGGFLAENFVYDRLYRMRVQR
jgi:hypothetical protein